MSEWNIANRRAFNYFTIFFTFLSTVFHFSTTFLAEKYEFELWVPFHLFEFKFYALFEVTSDEECLMSSHRDRSSNAYGTHACAREPQQVKFTCKFDAKKEKQRNDPFSFFLHNTVLANPNSVLLYRKHYYTVTVHSTVHAQK